jgi:lipopolysaccharide transport system permease protein
LLIKAAASSHAIDELAASRRAIAMPVTGPASVLNPPDAARRPVVVLRPPAWGDVWSAEHARSLRASAGLFVELSRHRLNVRYKQSILGPAWAVIQPLAMMAVFTFVFARLARIPSDGAPYALFAYAGLLPWTFFNTAVSSGTVSLTSHAGLVTKVAFPREIIPATYVVAAGVDLLIGSTIFVALATWHRYPLGPHVWYAVPVVLCLAVFALAVALVLSAVHVQVRDVGVALPVILQLAMFASPVLYPLAAVPSHLRFVYSLNPLVGYVEAFRRALLGLPLDAQSLAISLAATLLAVLAGYAVFKRMERTLADII